MRTAVAIMAKAPWPGQVKTRLCPPLSLEEAADLYRCFLLDKIEQLRSLAGASLAISYAPAEAAGVFETLAPGVLLVAQEGPDLGARLANTFARLFARGFTAALAIDSDTPSLPTRYLEAAVERLASPDVDLVLGPSDDGGYYLIGMRSLEPELFEAMPWSTSRVLPETIRRAAARGLRVAHLPTWFDVDTYADLERLEASLPGTDAAFARHTRRFFERRAA